jgi:cytochrome c
LNSVLFRIPTEVRYRRKKIERFAGKGEQQFTANCAVCHQATGEGLPGAFPALKGDAV